MVTDQGNVTSQLLMMACARSATKRRGQQKQILWDALHRRIPASNVRGKAPTEADALSDLTATAVPGPFVKDELAPTSRSMTALAFFSHPYRGERLPRP